MNLFSPYNTSLLRRLVGGTCIVAGIWATHYYMFTAAGVGLDDAALIFFKAIFSGSEQVYGMLIEFAVLLLSGWIVLVPLALSLGNKIQMLMGVKRFQLNLIAYAAFFFVGGVLYILEPQQTVALPAETSVGVTAESQQEFESQPTELQEEYTRVNIPNTNIDVLIILTLLWPSVDLVDWFLSKLDYDDKEHINQKRVLA